MLCPPCHIAAGGGSTLCDLSAIFNRQSISYTKRFSTGSWGQDGLSMEEELVYKRGLGFVEEEDLDGGGIFLTSSPEKARSNKTYTPPPVDEADEAEEAAAAAAEDV